MKNDDKPQFAALMGALSEYYNRDISDALIGMYWQGLEHYELAAVREALNRHMQNTDTGQFFPKIADIGKMLSGTSNDRALLAWAKVDKALRHIGPYQTVAFDDALIHRVLQDMGGWISLGMQTDDEWPFVAKEFENRYRGFSLRNERPDYPKSLIGLAEANNQKEGFGIEPPVLIGNAEQAKRVLLGGSNTPMIGFTRVSDVAPPLRLVESNKDDAA